MSEAVDIAVLKTQVATLMKSNDDISTRIAAIERRQWIWTGGGLALGTLLGMFGNKFLMLFSGDASHE